MLYIKTRIKIKSLKKKLLSFWYFIMKPLAYMLTKIYKFKLMQKQDKISKWTDEYAMRLCSKILIKDMIKYNENNEEFVVAEWCDKEEWLKTIRDFIIEQRYNSDLRSWGYKLPFYDANRIEKLTELLRVELEKHDEIECQYIIDKAKYSYWGRSRNYKTTLHVKLKVEK